MCVCVCVCWTRIVHTKSEKKQKKCCFSPIRLRVCNCRITSEQHCRETESDQPVHIGLCGSNQTHRRRNSELLWSRWQVYFKQPSASRCIRNVSTIRAYQIHVITRENKLIALAGIECRHILLSFGKLCGKFFGYTIGIEMVYLSLSPVVFSRVYLPSRFV